MSNHKLHLVFFTSVYVAFSFVLFVSKNLNLMSSLLCRAHSLMFFYRYMFFLLLCLIFIFFIALFTCIMITQFSIFFIALSLVL